MNNYAKMCQRVLLSLSGPFVYIKIFLGVFEDDKWSVTSLVSLFFFKDFDFFDWDELRMK